MYIQTGTPGHKEYKWRPGHSKRNHTGTPGHKWRPGHREYKWRPGNSKRNYRPGHRNTNDDRDKNDDRDTGNINDDRDTQREITDWDTGTQMTTGTQGNNNNGDAGGTGGYINDDRDTGNVRLAITINKAQWQSLESWGITRKLKKGKKLKKDQFKNECIYRPGHQDTNDDRDTGTQGM